WNVARATRDGRRQHSVGRRYHSSAGEDAVAEVAEQRESFIMSPSRRLEDDLRNKIRCRIKGVIGCWIVKTATSALRTKNEVILARGEMPAQRGLRILDRHSPR